jgi:hypothetical protein
MIALCDTAALDGRTDGSAWQWIVWGKNLTYDKSVLSEKSDPQLHG